MMRFKTGRMWRPTLVALLLVWGGTVEGACPDPTGCYCELAPGGHEYLIKAEVTEVGEDSTRVVLLVEMIYQVPQDTLEEMHLLQEYECDFGHESTSLVVGDVGIFDVQYYSASGWNIRNYLLPVNGLYPCNTIPEFEGLTNLDLVSVLLADDCTVAAKELGVTIECDEGGCGCSPGDSASGQAGGVLLLVLLAAVLAFVPGKSTDSTA